MSIRWCTDSSFAFPLFWRDIWEERGKAVLTIFSYFEISPQNTGRKPVFKLRILKASQCLLQQCSAHGHVEGIFMPLHVCVVKSAIQELHHPGSSQSVVPVCHKPLKKPLALQCSLLVMFHVTPWVSLPPTESPLKEWPFSKSRIENF